MSWKTFAAQIIIGLSAIGAATYIVYEFLFGPLRDAEKRLKYWMEEYAKQVKQYATEQEGALTEAQEAALERKRDEMDTALRDVQKARGDIYDTVVKVAVIVGGAFVVSAVAKEFVRTYASRAKTPAGACALIRNAINVDFAATGRVTLAISAQTSLDAWARTSLYPTMTSQIAFLSAQIPNLVGWQLLYTQLMVTGMQIEMATVIPAYITAAWALIPMM